MTDQVDINFCLDMMAELKRGLRNLKNSLFYRELEIKNLKLEIEQKASTISELNIAIIENCNHEWVNDFVDSMFPYRLSQPIRYCTKCELTDCTTVKAPH